MAGLRLLRRPEAAPRAERKLHLLARIELSRRRAARFMWDHRGALMLVVILGIAALPRMWAILGVGFRGDEAVYAGQAAVLAGDDQLDRYFVLASRGNSNFLFYQQVVALLYLIFGVSDVAARLVSIGFSLGTVLVCFEIGRTLYSRNVGLLGAAFFAVSGYSVLLGRLALLDSTFVFLFSLCFLFFAKWITSRRDVWLYGFAATFALTLQCKVTGVLVIVIAVNYLLVSRQLRFLSIRRFLLASMAFLVFFIPVLVQIALKSDQLLEFLSDSGARATHVPWYYYLDKLIAFEGYLTPAVWLVGIALALRRWTAGDRLLIFWAFVVLLFFHVYPLKAFNYMLPLIPALSILAGRGVHDVALAAAARWKHLRRRSRVARAAGAGVVQPVGILAAFGVVTVLAMPVIEVARTDTYFGLREAARWLKSNTSPQDGVMTLSKGSAQYALSFYARRDSYPYGRFRLATIFPGGEVRSPRPSADGSPSADWVSYWPPRLIRSRKVSYLVYYTDEGDDPPENPLVDNEHQERFRRFIESYGGKLMHVVYRHHEGRAWIYKVTKLYARPKITYRAGTRRLTVRGRGYRFNSRVTLYYRQKQRGTYATDANGAFTARIPMPYYVNPRYFLIATDDFGNYASRSGLRPTLRNKRARRRLARRTQGSAVQPGTIGDRPATAGQGGLAVKIDMPDAVQVGSELPMRVRVNAKSEGLASVPQSRVFFRITSLDGKTPVRSRQRTTNTLGLAYMNLAAIELPGFYRLSIVASKGSQRGTVTRTFKVRRR